MGVKAICDTNHVSGNFATASATVVPAIVGDKIYIYSLIITIGSPGVTVQLQDTIPTNLSQAFNLNAGGSITLDVRHNLDAWWISTKSAGLALVQSGTTTVSYDIWYLQGV